MTEKIIFADSNVVLPNSSWELFSAGLDKYRKGNLLTFNDTIDSNQIETAKADLEEITKTIQANNYIYITKGVAEQVKNKITAIQKNIEERMQPYVFAEFNVVIPEDARKKSTQNYTMLLEYSKDLNTLSSLLSKKPYSNKREQPLMLINTFFKEIKNNFSDATKEKHKHENNTDESLASIIAFESLLNGKDVNAYTNEKDIPSLVGSLVYMLNKIGPASRRIKAVDSFLTSPPQICQYPSKQQWNTAELGNKICSNFSGVNANTSLTETQKTEYNNKTESFALYLINFINGIAMLKEV
jgi:hypothetical protein